METIDLTQTLPAGTSSMLSAGGILMLSAIIVLVVVIMKRWKARVMPGILGVIAYAVFVFIFANLATTMEYSVDQTSWTACTGTTLTQLSDGDYYVRYKETNNYYASPSWWPLK